MKEQKFLLTPRTHIQELTTRGVNVGGVHPQTYVSVGLQMSAVGLKI